MGNVKQAFVKGESSAKSEEGNFKTESFSPKLSGPMGCAEKQSRYVEMLNEANGLSPAPAGKERADRQELGTAGKIAVGAVVVSSILLCGPAAIFVVSAAAVDGLAKLVGIDIEGDEPPEKLSREEIEEKRGSYGPDMSD